MTHGEALAAEYHRGYSDCYKVKARCETRGMLDPDDEQIKKILSSWEKESLSIADQIRRMLRTYEEIRPSLLKEPELNA